MTGTIILKMAFGYSVKVSEERDELLHLVEEATNSFILSTAAGAFFADVFPIRESFAFVIRAALKSHVCTCSVRYVPSWLSITAWKEKVREWSEILDKMHDLPYNFAEEKAVICSCKRSLSISLIPVSRRSWIVKPRVSSHAIWISRPRVKRTDITSR